MENARKIIILTESPTDGTILSTILSSLYSLEIQIVHSWEEGKKFLAEIDQIDAVFIDAELPDANGYDICPVWKEKRVPVVLLSEFGSEEVFDAHRRTPNHADLYFIKPLDQEKFIDELKKVFPTWADSDRAKEQAAAPATVVHSDKGFSAAKKSDGASVEISFEEWNSMQKYIRMKDREVEDLQAAIRQYRETITLMEKRIDEYEENRQKNRLIKDELVTQAKNLEKKIEMIKTEHERALDEQKNYYRDKIKRLELVEIQYEQFKERHELLKDRVKHDIRKIQTREKDLENKLEIFRRDSEALINSKDQQIMELQRTVESHEFEIENLQEKILKSNQMIESLEGREKKALKTLKLVSQLFEYGDIDSETGGPGGKDAA